MHNMRGAKFIRVLKIDCFARKIMYRGTASFACKQLFEWQNISQQQDISTKHEHQRSISFKNSPILSICFEALNWHISLAVHGDAEQEVVSHPFPPALPLVCAASVCPPIRVSVQIVQSASLHSFKLVFLVSAGN